MATGGGDWDIEQVRAAIFHIIDDCGTLMIKDDWKTPTELIDDMREEQGREME